MIQSTKNNLLKAGVFITSVTQIISPLFSTFRDNKPEYSTDPQITPAGYTFAIWGVITLLALLYGTYQLLPQRKNRDLHQKLSKGIILVYILFSAWLFAADRDWQIVTLLIFLCMFFTLRVLLEIILKEQQKLNLLEKIILEAQIAIYTGWSTIAIFANIGSVIKFYGFSDLGMTGILWQSILLLAALGNSILGLYKFSANLFYAATILWAFTGVFVGLQDESNVSLLKILAILGIVVVLVMVFYVRSKNNTKMLQRASFM